MTPKPLPPSTDPVAKYTRSQTASQGIAHHVAVDPCQADHRSLPRKFTLDLAMPVMDNVKGETLEHCQL